MLMVFSLKKDTTAGEFVAIGKGYTLSQIWSERNDLRKRYLGRYKFYEAFDSLFSNRSHFKYNRDYIPENGILVIGFNGTLIDFIGSHEVQPSRWREKPKEPLEANKTIIASTISGGAAISTNAIGGYFTKRKNKDRLNDFAQNVLIFMLSYSLWLPLFKIAGMG